MKRLRRWWLDFWHGPVCPDCHERHHRNLPDLALCLARCALDRHIDNILRANGVNLGGAP